MTATIEICHFRCSKILATQGKRMPERTSRFRKHRKQSHALMVYTLFFNKKHNYKKHRPISAKTLRNIQGYSRKPKKHFIEEIMVKRLKITFPRYLHWRNINLFCSYSHCVSIWFLTAISKRFYLTLRLCNMLAEKHLRKILTQKLAKL